MLDSLTTANHTDFRQRYERTYGWFIQGDGVKILVHVESVTPAGVVFRDTKKREFTIFRDSGLNFEFIQVTRGWFNGPKNTYYFSRHPARQFHRGISANNTAVYNIYKGVLANHGLTMEAMSDVFENSPPLSKALSDFSEGGRTSLAIGKHFCADSSGSFYFNDRVVGRYSKGAIALEEATIHQEVGDVLRRNNIPFQLSLANT